MNKVDNQAKGIKGKVVGPEPSDEREHFYTCPNCGQSVDYRDLGAVLHHETPGHQPITPEA